MIIEKKEKTSSLRSLSTLLKAIGGATVSIIGATFSLFLTAAPQATASIFKIELEEDSYYSTTASWDYFTSLNTWALAADETVPDRATGVDLLDLGPVDFYLVSSDLLDAMDASTSVLLDENTGMVVGFGGATYGLGPVADYDYSSFLPLVADANLDGGLDGKDSCLTRINPDGGLSGNGQLPAAEATLDFSSFLFGSVKTRRASFRFRFCCQPFRARVATLG